ncbi:ribosome maturation factor RimP [Nocardia amikacinitolerans]|uniref:Ribosome maturation factor RimP n=1 Tax=Nocardia amikacinitolerans TaxID=756689 RepID=A0A285LW59_9NOCA|nr:ribosome maturation factor RimP [Nocardia amikacinitolerans]MCP2280168.1 ribosome maturation factor RimP [Nocardia amikacinitolerans]MCP2299439.1 ribosome maturation factor RimP [Nocardia amikacinitolerans]SNY88693.1 ribosome maturation factor RimP [Nocardia amikacinitolerans]
MPMPTEERVSQLVAGLVERRGFDLEGVEISTAGKHADAQAKVKVTVDSDGTADLDTIATLSSELSLLLDDAGEFGETPYLLEVSTPGIDRPLTADRHWRRAQGRKVRVTLRPGAEPPDPGGSARFEARVGALGQDSVALVLGGKRNPHRVHVPLADIAEAVVQVEFSAPGERELELAGGVAPGRPKPGHEDDALAVDDAADARGNTDALPVTASDSTEGIVE